MLFKLKEEMGWQSPLLFREVILSKQREVSEIGPVRSEIDEATKGKGSCGFDQKENRDSQFPALSRER